MTRTAALRSHDYFLPQTNAERKRRYNARHPRTQHLLPFRGPCPTPLGCKVYLPKSGSIALSLLGQVMR